MLVATILAFLVGGFCGASIMAIMVASSEADSKER